MTGRSDALFTEADVWDGDPIRPDMDTPTPLGVVASLTQRDREVRLGNLIRQAHDILDLAISQHRGKREVVAECVLFSGGNDSTTLAHLFRGRATHAIHANTTIGIESTRQFVRHMCREWGLPLIEKLPPDDYRALVLGRIANSDGSSVWAGGFPGPGAHWICYQRLKERCLDSARHDLGIANSRTKCAVYLAGRRRQESERREDVPLHEPDGSVIWASPMALWTKLDITTYRQRYGVPQCDASALIHMSGECLCGAFARPGELDEIGYWFPDVKAQILLLADEVRAAGFEAPVDEWGHGKGVPSRRGRLCSSCLPPDGWQTIDFAGESS